MSALDLFTSAAGGGLIGIIGAGVKDIFGFLGTKEKHKHTLAMRAYDLKELEIESKRSAAEAESAERTAMANAAAQGIKASHENDKASYGILWIDALKGTVKPTITAFLLFFSAWFTYAFYVRYGMYLSAATKAEILLQLVYMFIFLTTASVGWWFGSSSSSYKGFTKR